ncbi:MAG: enoyl-CoA hydratase-related protein [Lachnospiraceae bacterium]|nr:enoyl-CoA hydratase-related protein [Lachnospiraceae bacterium]
MENVLFEARDGIGYVTINRPKALNALNTDTLNEIIECFAKISESKDIKVVIVTGAGEKAFVAGADIAQMSSMNAIEGREMALLGQKAFLLIENTPQVVIAAVNGYALGGGCELSMACDIRVAAENAKFGQPEVNLGILPGFGGTQRLSRLVGRSIAKELIFTADQIDAAEAYRIGLANKVVPKEELMNACEEMAKKIMSKGMYGVSLAKVAINRGVDIDMETGNKLEADMFGLCFATDDQKEGMKAFLEKRKAAFKDF